MQINFFSSFLYLGSINIFKLLPFRFLLINDAYFLKIEINTELPILSLKPGFFNDNDKDWLIQSTCLQNKGK